MQGTVLKGGGKAYGRRCRTNGLLPTVPPALALCTKLPAYARAPAHAGPPVPPPVHAAIRVPESYTLERAYILFSTMGLRCVPGGWVRWGGWGGWGGLAGGGMPSSQRMPTGWIDAAPPLAGWLAHGCRHLVVVDEHNRVRGMVTRKDLLGYRLDEAVQRARTGGAGGGPGRSGAVALNGSVSLEVPLPPQQQQAATPDRY